MTRSDYLKQWPGSVKPRPMTIFYLSLDSDGDARVTTTRTVGSWADAEIAVLAYNKRHGIEEDGGWTPQPSSRCACFDDTDNSTTEEVAKSYSVWSFVFEGARPS